MNPREDFGQKSIEMQRNLCHLLIPAHPFRACTSQDKGTYPLSTHTKKRKRCRMCISAADQKGCVYTRTVHCWLYEAWGSRELGLGRGCEREDVPSFSTEVFRGTPSQTEQCHKTRVRCSLGDLFLPSFKVQSTSLWNSLFQLTCQEQSWKGNSTFPLPWVM